MPTMVVIIARVRPNDCSDVNCWRRDLLNAFDPAHFSPDGPLRMLGFDEWKPVKDDGLWLDVGIECPMYEKGYERGDPELFVCVTEWLERRIAGCEVWLGQDADDDSVKPFDAPRREALLTYFRQVGHQPYTTALRPATGT